MIKEKKIAKNIKKPLKRIFFEYIRTILLSLLVALSITIGLTDAARREMLENVYARIEDQAIQNKYMAEHFIQSNSNLLSDIKNKQYAVCMHIGDLYEMVGDYEKAQIAYKSATEKTSNDNYKPYYKLIGILVAQGKFDEAEKIISKINDYPNKKLVKFKTRVNIVIGDKYYSIGKFLSAAKSYERADFYYSKFKKQDKVVAASIKKRIITSYEKAADTLVKSGYNSDAVRYLKIVEKYVPNDLKIKYKIGIILSDSDPESAVKYLEPLLDKIPQDIDYGVYCTALMKSANIADLDGRTTEAKAYRYKIHSMDMFVKRKIVYKNDVDAVIDTFTIRKIFLTYPLKAGFNFFNMSGADIKRLKADFVLCLEDKPLETVTSVVALKEKPLLAGGYDPNNVSIKFKRKIYTKKELANYKIKIYAYKDDKFKTLINEVRIPEKTYSNGFE